MKGRKILREQLHFTEQNAETLMGQISLKTMLGLLCLY